MRNGLCWLMFWCLSADVLIAQTPPVVIVRPPVRDEAARGSIPAELKQRYRIADRHPILGLAFVPKTNSILVAQRDGSVLLIDRHDGRLISQCKLSGGGISTNVVVDAERRQCYLTLASYVYCLSLPDLNVVWKHQAMNPPHYPLLTSLALSADGTQLAAGGMRSPVLLMNALQGNVIEERTHAFEQVASVSFTKDGQILIAGSAMIQNVKPPYPWAARWNPDQRGWDPIGKSPQRLTVFGIWERPDGQLALHNTGNIRMFDPQSLNFHETIYINGGPVSALSGNHRRYATAMLDGVVHFHDCLLPRVLLGQVPTEFRVEQLALNHDGTELLAGCNNGDVQWWHLRFQRGPDEPASAIDPENLFIPTDLTQPEITPPDEQGIVRFDGHRDTIQALAPYPDNQHVLTCGADERAILWNVAEGRVVKKIFERKIGPIAVHYGAAISPDGKHLLLVGGYNYKGSMHAELRDPFTLETRLKLEGVTNRLTLAAFSPDSTLCAAASREHDLMIWDVQTGQLKKQFPLPTPDRNRMGFLAITFSADSQQIIATTGDDVRIWSIETGKEINRQELRSSLLATVHPKRPELLVASGNELRLLSLPDFVVRRSFPATNRLRTAAMTSDGTQIFLVNQDRIELWGNPTKTFVTGHIDLMNLTPNGKHILFTEVNTLAAKTLP